MADLVAGVGADLGAGTGGVWTSAQARAAGLSEGAIARRLASGRWQRLQRGVLCDGAAPATPLQRAWGVVLSRGGPGSAWAAGRTLARVWGLPLVDDDDPATGHQDADHDDVVVRTARPADVGTLHVRRPRLVRGVDTVLVEGCPCLTLESALPGLVAVLRPDALVCLLDAALHRELLTAEQLQQAVRRARGRPTGPALRQAAALSDGRSESPLETLSRLLLLPVLPALVPQVRLRDERGRVLARFDLADEAARFAVEADGRAGHAGESKAEDARRDRTTVRRGWHTERLTWWEVRCRPAQARAWVLEAYERHRRQR